MKHYRNKKNHKRFKRFGKPVGNRGFTLIETLFSLLLISLSLLFITQLMVGAIDAHGKSNTRFKMVQLLEFSKNELVSKSFDADELKAGCYSKAEGPFKMSWNTRDISPLLKVIRFSISYKRITKYAYFYKSKHIKNLEGR